MTEFSSSDPQEQLEWHMKIFMLKIMGSTVNAITRKRLGILRRYFGFKYFMTPSLNVEKQTPH